MNRHCLRDQEISMFDQFFCCHRVLLLGVCSFILLSSPAYADGGLWTSLGPEGGYIQTLVIDPQNPQTLYVGTSPWWSIQKYG
jgi:hypothetical protein